MPNLLNRLPRIRALTAECVIAIFLVSAFGPSARAAEDDLRRELAEVAKQIKGLLDQKGQDAIAVGEFRGPAHLASSSGPAIAKSLGDALKALDVAVKRRAE